MKLGRGESHSGGHGQQSRLRVFVSYRREDTADAADHLFADLTGHAEWDVFMDIDSLEPGVDFPTIIERSVGSCDVLLALIGKRWLEAEDEGRRRLDDPEDWVRLEIEAALKRNVRVIPILLQEAEMPSGDQLPSGLQGLARRHAHEIDRTHWPEDVGRLEKVLGKIHADKRLPDGRRWRRVLLVGGLLVAAVILSAVLVWLMREPSPPQREPKHALELRTMSWELLEPSGSGANDEVINDVVAVPEGGGYVAGGKDGTAAAVWRSRDGQNWERVPSDDFDSDTGSLSVSDIIAPNPDLILVIGGETSAGAKDVVVWRSEGGEESTFQRLPTEFLDGGDDRVATCVRGTPPEKGVGLLMGGFEGSPGNRVASIWSSTTHGETWVRASVGNHESWDEARINRILCFPAESCDLFLAVGSSTKAGNKDATVWTSTSGREWKPKVIRAAGEQGMTDATVFDSKLVAVGFDRGGADSGAAVWLSESSGGRDWSPAPDPEGSLRGPGFIANSLSAPNFNGPPGLIAVGTGQEVEGTDHEALVWTSEDGLRWFRESDPAGVLGGPGNQEIRGIAARDDFPVIAVGESMLGNEDAAIWMAQRLSA